jgi:serine/threonine-protein phosphatase 2B catalytic subunit
MQPRLPDPNNDRAVKSFQPPPHRPLPRNLMFPEKLKNKPDWKLIRDHLQKEGRIAKEELVKLVTDTNKIFKNEGNLIYLQDPLSVVGDIHGQYFDALKILEIGGNPENTKYLFLGDFVDRGSFSIEVLILLYSLKISFPDTINMLRGNHECRQMTTFFNFRTECLYKYDQEVYDMFMDSFDLLPLACVINGKFIGVHGGLSPELKTLDDINRLERFKEPPKQGLFCDLLWSDPVDNDDGICENIYRMNDVRGCSYFYGNEAVGKFLEQNNLLSVIRAHEAQLDGYKMHAWTGKSDFPVVITIFSAPNYCDVYNNKGAIIKFENNTLNIQQFNYTPHPYILPNFMDIFTWSIPFVSEKITEMLQNLIKPAAEDDEEDDDDNYEGLPKEIVDRLIAEKNAKPTPTSTSTGTGLKMTQQRKDVLKSKLKFVTKMAIMNKTLREQNETIIKLKHISPDNKIPVGLLRQGEDALKNALDTFKTARHADIINEKRPDH